MSIEGQVYDYLNLALNNNFENGMQFVVFEKDKCIINATVGFKDKNKTEKVTEDSIFPIFSTTKGVCATLVHIMAERNLLNYNNKMSEYWKDFKADVKVSEVLKMTAELYEEPDDLSLLDLLNWDYMCLKVANMLPKKEPSNEFTYHPLTFGWLAGNLPCLVTGKDFKTLLEEEIKKPLGIKNLYIGAPDEILNDIIDIYSDNELDNKLIDNEITSVNINQFISLMNTPLGRKICCPAASGVASAFELAKFYASFIGYKKPLLNNSQLKKALEDYIFSPQWGYRAYGYQLSFMDNDKSLDKVMFGHNGFNGSFAYCDTKNKLAFAFNKNFKSKNSISNRLIKELYKILGA